jgi:hypothetical protein
VIPLLYLRKEDYRFVSPEGQLILDSRHIFTSAYALDTFVGYAKSQLLNVKKGITGKYGAKRKALIEQFGYDVKFAYHTIRLLGMINEFFQSGQMNVHRGHHVPYLMSIRAGEVTEGEFFEVAEKLLAEVEASFMKATWIPAKPNFEAANLLCMKIVEMGKF